jgi:hypothetical protein
LAAGVNGLHGHFADHQQAIADIQAHAMAVAAQAEQAQTQAQHDAEVRANHEWRLAWQKVHSQEYGRQPAQQHEAAAAAQKQFAAERAREEAANKGAEAAQARQQQQAEASSGQSEEFPECNDFYQAVFQADAAAQNANYTDADALYHLVDDYYDADEKYQSCLNAAPNDAAKYDAIVADGRTLLQEAGVGVRSGEA